jgi:hypothetical protein
METVVETVVETATKTAMLGMEVSVERVGMGVV